jgi:two-component system, OmpR family, response regulator MprA
MTVPRVLVVEDDPPIARLVARTAQFEGADVTMAVDGLEARDAWEGGSFALVLLDAMLPGLDGISLCRERRLLGDRTPVVLITARQVEEVVELARDAEIDEVLAKPFAYDELVGILRRYLRGA